MTTASPYRFLTLAEVQDLTGLGYSTLRAKITDGTLPAVRIARGNGLRIRARDIDSLFEPVSQTFREAT